LLIVLVSKEYTDMSNEINPNPQRYNSILNMLSIFFLCFLISICQ